jgi:hypothetical protein
MGVISDFSITWNDPYLPLAEKLETIPVIGNFIGIKYILEGIAQVAKSIFQRNSEVAVKGLKDFGWGLFLQIPILSNIIAATSCRFRIIETLANKIGETGTKNKASLTKVRDAAQIARDTVGASSQHPQFAEIKELTKKTMDVSDYLVYRLQDSMGCRAIQFGLIDDAIRAINLLKVSGPYGKDLTSIYSKYNALAILTEEAETMAKWAMDSALAAQALLNNP